MEKIALLLTAIATLLVTSPAQAETDSLKTQTAIDIGLFLASYQYQEPGIMSLKGAKAGLDLSAMKAWQNTLFIRGDLRFAYGTVDYQSNGTGSASGEPDRYIEARGLFGKDWVFGNAALSPYAGVGYRYLFNDARGASSTGAAGYRRESNYLYLPIGMIYRKALNDSSRLAGTLEYDQLLAGKQISRLSDTGLGYGDVTNDQNDGYGLKLGFMYQKNTWAVGPYLYYWDIGKSDRAILYKNGTAVGYGWEPANNTVEFGFRASQQF